jgi:nucleotide-binding universal stress UspA family protein
MATTSLARHRVAPVERGFRRLLVPMLDNPESERAVEVACRLAAERHASVTVVTVVEVPPLLPLDARMDEEEDDARRLHRRAEEIADRYAVPVVARTIRAREAAPAILERLERGDFDLVVVGAARRTRARRGAPAFGRTVQNVLRKSPCRVLVIAAPRTSD